VGVSAAVESEAEPRTPTWPCTCSCGESWTEQQWAELPSDGRYDAGREGWLELRTCVCGARLAIACDPPAK
jgi:hypothetical protein